MDRWIERDLKYIWHPYTQMKDYQKYPPVLIEKAKGIKLFDNKGKFYYDTISSWWCNVHGHNHPKIKEAIKKQLNSVEHVLFAGFTHKPAITLAEKLIQLSPSNLTKVFFSDNGSTSVEVALKMSFQYWHNTGRGGKTKFVSLDFAFHGDTVGSMSVSGVDLFNEVFSPLFFPSFKVPSPYCYRCPVGKSRESCEIECSEPLEKLLKERNEEICAVILEPLVLAAGGMIVYPKAYLKKVSQLAKKYDIHLIVDEVATGFGRTGEMFASEHVNIKPDFMCLSKGITAGYMPFGATLTTEKIYKAFYADYNKKKTFYHGHTHTANPLACSVGIASLEIFKKERVLSRINKIIPFLHNGLEKMRDLPFVGDVRSIGMIGALELVRDKKKRGPFKFTERIGMKIYNEGLKRNILLRPLGNIVYLFLPLCIRKSELQDILDRCHKTIKSIEV
jgi:adenosylmethionine-8-amino-7-oxononanoate aminotransferase